MFKIYRARDMWQGSWALPSQKATGLLYGDVFTIFVVGSEVQALHSGEPEDPEGTVEASSEHELMYLLSGLLTPDEYFIRPCPVVPRHGVYESRAVTQFTEMVQVISDMHREMRLHGDLPIVAVQPFISGCTANGVLALPLRREKGVAAFGFGHDGVTGATSETVQFEVVYSRSRRVPSIYRDKDVEVECVATMNRNFITQWRVMNNGLSGNFASLDTYLPYQPFEVREVYEFKSEQREDFIGDYGLLLLEEYCKSREGQPGVIIVHRNGNLLSHAAAHAITNRIAYTVCDVKVGDVIESACVEPPPIEDFIEQLEAGYRAGCTFANSDEPFRFSLLYHLFLAGQRNRLTAFATGFHAAELLARAAAASLGECRHVYSQTSSSRFVSAKTVWKVVRKLGVEPGSSRSGVYDFVLENAHPDLVLAALGLSLHVFAELEWATQYGGSRWATATHKALQSALKLRRGEWESALLLLNDVENAHHNNGRYLSKFATANLDYGTREDIPSFSWGAKTIATLHWAMMEGEEAQLPSVPGWMAHAVDVIKNQILKKEAQYV